jgi:WD40 repeat protein
MPRVSCIGVVVACLCAGGVSAQSGTAPRVDPQIVGEPLTPRSRLSLRALVPAPAPIKDVVSWTIETRRVRHRLSAVALSPDGKLVATGGIDGIIRLWDVASGTLVRALVGHDSYVYGLAFSPGGRYLASGGAFDYTARIWEVATGQPLRVLKGHPDYVVQVAWSGDGRKLIATGGTSGEVSVWNVTTGLKTAKASLGQHVLALAADPIGERFAAVTTGSAVLVVDTVKGKAQRELGLPADKYSSIAWSPDGKVLAAGSAKGTILYDPNTAKVVAKLDAPAVALAWSADGGRLATAGSDNVQKLWNAADWALLHKFNAVVNAVHLLPGDAGVLTSEFVNLSTYQWADGKRTAHHEITGVEPPYWQAGRPIVTGVQTPVLSLWENATGRRRARLEGHGASVVAFAYSPDGKSIATASYDKTVNIYETAKGALQRKLSKHAGPVLSVAWSPDGKEIATGGQDKKTLIWDTKSGELTHTLEHGGAVACLAYSPGGSILAAGSDDGKVTLFARPGYKAKKPLTTPNQTSPLCLAWTTDGKTLAAGDVNGTAVLWSPAKAKLLGEVGTVGSPPQINGMVFYAKGEQLATARGNHTLVLWSTATAKAGHTMQTMAPAVHVTWSAPHLAVAAQDRTCRFFEPISGKQHGLLLAEADQIVAISKDGHYRADGPAADGLVYVVQTQRGQETLSPSDFAARFKWKNDKSQVRFAGK